MRQTVLAKKELIVSRDKKFVGKLGAMTFTGQYEIDQHHDSVNSNSFTANIWVVLSFAVHTEEDEYKIMVEEVPADEYYQEDSIIHDVEDTIETYFKELGVKGQWK
jgi:hypothetical protein